MKFSADESFESFDVCFLLFEILLYLRVFFIFIPFLLIMTSARMVAKNIPIFIEFFSPSLCFVFSVDYDFGKKNIFFIYIDQSK